MMQSLARRRRLRLDRNQTMNKQALHTFAFDLPMDKDHAARLDEALEYLKAAGEGIDYDEYLCEDQPHIQLANKIYHCTLEELPGLGQEAEFAQAFATIAWAWSPAADKSHSRNRYARHPMRISSAGDHGSLEAAAGIIRGWYWESGRSYLFSGDMQPEMGFAYLETVNGQTTPGVIFVYEGAQAYYLPEDQREMLRGFGAEEAEASETPGPMA